MIFEQGFAMFDQLVGADEMYETSQAPSAAPHLSRILHSAILTLVRVESFCDVLQLPARERQKAIPIYWPVMLLREALLILVAAMSARKRVTP